MKRLVIGRGSVFADLLVIGEAPGAQEDLEGKPYVGKSGKLLNELLVQAGIDYKKDVYFCNVIKCRPPFFLNLFQEKLLESSQSQVRLIPLKMDILLVI